MRRVVALIGALAVLVTACGDDGGDPEVVRLVTHDAFAVSDDVLAAFEAASGYTVEIVAGSDAGSVVNQAVLTAGDPVGDVLFGVDNTFLTRALDADVFEAYRAAGLETVRGDIERDAGHRVTPIDTGDVCLNYDRDFFSGDLAPPASLEDLADPAYAELTVVQDPAVSSPGLAFLLATIAEYGDDWQDFWTRLDANGVRIAPDWTTAYFVDFSVGGGGDRPIVVSYASSPPADVVFAEEPKDEPSIGVVDAACFRQIEYAGVLAGAGNPEGARALIDFMLTETFQADMPLNMFVFPAVVDVPLPEVFRDFAATPASVYEMNPAEIGAGRDAWIDEWTELVVG